VQYDTPDAILAAPADDFVGAFVGEDRALRRLALRRLADVRLESADGVVAPELPASASVRNALSAMVAARADAVVVVGEDGNRLGAFRLESAEELLR
jgi:osmoprotectant transport system ATP-binding protein